LAIKTVLDKGVGSTTLDSKYRSFELSR